MQDGLQHLLQTWEVSLRPDPNFRAAVWGRIAAHKQRLSFRIRRRTEEFVGRPAGAAAVIAALLFTGGAAGTAWRARHVEDERAAGFAAYVAAVDPLAHTTTFRP